MRLITQGMVLGLFLSAGSIGLAQPLRAVAPILIQARDLEHDRNLVWVRPTEKDESLDAKIYTERGARLTFYFKKKSSREVSALSSEAIKDKRAVQILDGQKLIGEGRVWGFAEFGKGNGQRLAGLNVDFDSLATAKKVADALMESEDDYLSRHFANERLWR